MLLILTILYLFQGSPTHAAPFSFFQRDTIPSASSSVDQCTCPDQRSIWDILWSCLATIFACSWVSVHPNMAEPEEPWWKMTLRRIVLMFWAILAPEMVIMWAMRQWLGARKLERLFRDKKWTKRHGYFIQMGGFMLYDGDRKKGVLFPEQLKELYEDGKIDFPTVTEEEIEDRSKADGLAKTIVVVQTVWFILQCIARGVQGLVLTQLELFTVSVAFLNSFMYLFWWHKPMDVQTPIPVYLLDIPKEKPVMFDVTDTVPTENIFNELKHYPLNAIHFIISPFSSAWSTISKLVKNKGILWIIYTLFIDLPVRGIRLVVKSALDISDRYPTDTNKEGQMRVPAFYALSTPRSEMPRVRVFICSTAVAFGGIQCGGWFFDFPSHPEGLIWQISSVVVTGVPLFFLASNLLLWVQASQRNTMSGRIFGIVEKFLWILLLVLGAPAYVVARIFLMVESFIGLRDLSAGAHAQVEWTTFIPHI